MIRSLDLMSRKFIFVLSISLWVSSCFVPAAAQDVLLDSLLSDGKKAFANRSYAASEKKLKAALSETESFSNDDKRLPEVLRTLAAVLDRERKLDEAVALYKRLVEIDEKSADQSGRSVLSGDLSNYANCLKRKGQSEAALKIYTRLDDLLSNAPVKNGSGIGDRVNNLINMAQAYGNIGQFTEQE